MDSDILTALLGALIILCLICWRMSVQLGKIELILSLQIKALDKIDKEGRVL